MFSEKVPDGSSTGGCWTRLSQEHIEIYTQRKRKILLRVLRNEQFLNNKREKGTKQGRLGNHSSPGAVGTLGSCRNPPDPRCWWAPLCMTPSTSLGKAGALFGGLTCVQVHTQIHYPGHISARNKRSKQDQQGVTTQTWPPCLSCSSLAGQHPGTMSTCLTPAGCQTNATHIADTHHFYTRSLFQDWTR